MRITSNLAVILMVVVAYALWAQDVPFRVKGQAEQWNFDDLAARGNLRMPDYGKGTLAGGSLYVDLNVNYISVDTFVAFATRDFDGYLAPTDTIRTYICRKLSGSSIMIYAVLNGVRNYFDSSTVSWLTILKDR